MGTIDPAAIRQEFAAKVGLSFQFSPEVLCDGLGVGDGSLNEGLSFAEGSLVTVLAPGQNFRKPMKRARRAQTTIRGNGIYGTLVFCGSPLLRTGEYFHFGVDISTAGVKIVEKRN